MKKGCLYLFLTPIILLLGGLMCFFLFPAKPATDLEKKEKLTDEYTELQKTDQVEKFIKVFKSIEKNKDEILDSIPEPMSNSLVLVNVTSYSDKQNHLPIHLFKKYKKILKKLKGDLFLEVDFGDHIRLVHQKIDYHNYLYINHSVSYKNTTNELPNIYKKCIEQDEYSYCITIKEAFYDIDPNNFAPN